MVETIDMEKLAQEEQARRAAPAPFQSAVGGIQGPTADEEAKMRELLSGVTLDNLNDTVQVPAPSAGQPTPSAPIATQQTQPTQAPAADVPTKFLKPDGTVDEEKLKASSEQLGKAIEQKALTIDELVSKYKEQEKQFTELGQKAKQLKETPPNPEPQPLNQTPPPDQIRQQLLALQQNDPIAFAVEIARAVARKEAAEIAQPALEVTGRLAEQERDHQMRANLLSLAQRDPRVQDPALYAELINELNSDPAYYRLKNPIKSAWNEVKERKRLGEPQGSAQPSNTAPTLGRGTPPSVSSLPQPMSPQVLREQVSDPRLNPFSQEGKQLEEQLLKQLAEQAWRG